MDSSLLYLISQAFNFREKVSYTLFMEVLAASFDTILLPILSKISK